MMNGSVAAVVGGIRPSPGSVATAFSPQQQGEVVPLQELEKQAIRNALHHTGGDRTTAAQLLGIGRTTLYRKLKEYGFD
jgi:two-component system response regulator HydG